MGRKLSGRMRLILAVLEVYGASSTGSIMKIVYPGQELYLGRQRQYVLRTLHILEKQELIEKDVTGVLWKITEKGKDALH